MADNSEASSGPPLSPLLESISRIPPNMEIMYEKDMVDKSSLKTSNKYYKRKKNTCLIL